MNRLFVANQNDVEAFLSKLELTKEDSWEPMYQDPITKINWIGYRLDDNPGDQPPTMLRRLDMQTKDVCEAAASTEYNDEAAAAGHFIRWGIPSDEAMSELVNSLENHTSNNPSDQVWSNVQLSIIWSGLNEALNSRPITGKSPASIDDDYNYYKNIAARAENIRRKSIEALGYEIEKNSDVFMQC